MQFLGKVGNGPMNKGLNFGSNPITIWIRGLFSGFVTIGRYGKWLTDINLLLKLICQMAALVRCPSVCSYILYENKNMHAVFKRRWISCNSNVEANCCMNSDSPHIMASCLTVVFSASMRWLQGGGRKTVQKCYVEL